MSSNAGQTRECDCGQRHFTIDEAIRHAKDNLAEGDGSLTKPIWGVRANRTANFGRVVGYQTEDGRRRFRLDYDPEKGVHVNEEDYSRPRGKQKVVHKVLPAMTPIPGAKEAWAKILEGHMQLYWQKWTSRYDKPPEVLEAEYELGR